eukprot:5203963-Lingulodinium_polyedra.AAC.1
MMDEGERALRVQFYSRDSAQLCVDTLHGHILDISIPNVVHCLFDTVDIRAGQTLPGPPPIDTIDPKTLFMQLFNDAFG